MKIDQLFVNGRFHTQDSASLTTDAVAVFAGRIIAVGEDARALAADSVIDLGGRFVVPGFNDAHLHFTMVGNEFTQLDLSPERVATLDELYRAVAAHASALPADAWVLGTGFDQNKLGAFPERRHLDAVAGGRPVHLLHCSKHMAVVNSAAFARAGFTDVLGVPDVTGGHVGREDGVPTGLLQEGAAGIVAHLLRPVPQGRIVDALSAASDWALSKGITSVTEPGIASSHALGLSPADVHAYQIAVERGLVRTRMTVMPAFDVLHDIGMISDHERGFGLTMGIRSGLGDDRLKIGGVKLAADGSLIGRTAAMCCDYSGEGGGSGLLHTDPEVLAERILLAHRNGWQVATHAIGDRAIDVVLDAYEAAQRAVPRPDARHRIEHAGVSSVAQVARIAAVGAIPVPQGEFLSRLGDGFLTAVGAERADRLYRMRSYLDHGIILPGSSDAPVVPGDPLIGLRDMVMRRTEDGVTIAPDERLTLSQALYAYTYGSAYASFDEHERGLLARGYLADFAVLSHDPFSVAPEEIGDLSVVATVGGGSVVYDNTRVLT